MKQTDGEILNHIVNRMETDRSEDAPDDAIRAVKNLYRTRRFAGRPSLAKRVLAALTINLAPDAAAYGERSAGAQGRQMLFQAEDYAVDIRVGAAENGVDVRGQIMGDGFENGFVVLMGESGELSAAIDDLGEFRLAGVPSGRYDISIKNDTTEIAVEGIEL